MTSISIPISKYVDERRKVVPANAPIKAYKGFDLTTTGKLKCLNTLFEIGKVHSIKNSLPIEVCQRGFHACEKLKNVKEFYGLPNRHVYCEVEQWGDIHYDHGMTKHASRHLKITRQLTLQEYFDMTKEAKKDNRVQINTKHLAVMADYDSIDNDSDAVMIINKVDGATVVASDSDFNNNIVISEKPATIVIQQGLLKLVKGCVIIDTENRQVLRVDGKKIKENVFYRLGFNGKLTVAEGL